MKITINESEFINRFLAIRPENFSREALRALFEYYEEIEQGGGGELEFDPIAICCDWTEYDSCVEAVKDYGSELDASQIDGDSEGKREQQAFDMLNDERFAIRLSSGCVVLN
jgi:hypothetical protein